MFARIIRGAIRTSAYILELKFRKASWQIPNSEIKGLKLINCTLGNTDLAFEYCSDVEADILGRVDSVKNPLSGRIVADEFGEIIMENDKVDVTKTAIETRKK